MIVRLINKPNVREARQLIEANGFSFEQSYDVLFGMFESGELIATAARDRNIFKMICIREDYRGGHCLGELVTALINSCAYTDLENYFVFTSPERMSSFEQMNFNPLVTEPEVCLLEYGNGLERYLARHRDLVREGDNGAVVMNCNPFTNGHLYLIEQAASQVDHLYVFVVREDRSTFPFRVRERLVREGTQHIGNLTVLDTSDYAISHVTFPAYFLKEEDNAQLLQMRTDLMLFARRIAPFFHITKRFVGSEPYCRTTRMYCEMMHQVLAEHRIATVQMLRKQQDGQPISAYRVRESLKQEAFTALKDLVPPCTFAFLQSEQVKSPLINFKTSGGRH